MPRATRISAMAKTAMPPELAGMFAACEDAYEQATREGYAENPAVIAAVSVLKSASRALRGVIPNTGYFLYPRSNKLAFKLQRYRLVLICRRDFQHLRSRLRS